mmetsp:Transcript_36637/g.96558  ORF Transcript_36637/g.96558 Transcript_36637/m.96558 type:complete len:83 (+) Transcript_36637:925-1173(+)
MTAQYVGVSIILLRACTMLGALCKTRMHYLRIHWASCTPKTKFMNGVEKKAALQANVGLAAQDATRLHRLAMISMLAAMEGG